MIHRNGVKAVLVSGCCLALTMTGCAYQGVNSLPLPGAVGRGPDSVKYTVQVPNVATLESNSRRRSSDSAATSRLSNAPRGFYRTTTKMSRQNCSRFWKTKGSRSDLARKSCRFRGVLVSEYNLRCERITARKALSRVTICWLQRDAPATPIVSTPRKEA